MTVGGLVSGFHRLMMMRGSASGTTRILQHTRSLERGGHSYGDLVVFSKLPTRCNFVANRHKHQTCCVSLVNVCLQPAA